MHRRARLLLPLFGFLLLAAPMAARAQMEVGVSVQLAPPMLPIYVQPPLPQEGYIWTPGYWAYADGGYFWVPGTWVEPPQIGYLWTPGYWGWSGRFYRWNAGYWGPHVGFYGGINYGFGYGGRGYDGGHWDNDRFSYNRAANNFGSVQVAAAYNAPVSARSGARVSFNGGRGGIAARPTATEQVAARDSHAPVTSAQTQHFTAARSTPTLSARQNHGAPPIAATSRPGQLTGPGTVAARGAGPNRANAATQRTPNNANGANAAAQRAPNARQAQPGNAAANRAGPNNPNRANNAATQRTPNGQAQPGNAATQRAPNNANGANAAAQRTPNARQAQPANAAANRGPGPSQPVHAAQRPEAQPAAPAHPQAAAARPAQAAPQPQPADHAAPGAGHDEPPARP